MVYASCYPEADTTAAPTVGVVALAAADGKLFYVLIIILIIILYNAYIHVHNALHVTSLKNPPITISRSRLFYVIKLLP